MLNEYKTMFTRSFLQNSYDMSVLSCVNYGEALFEVTNEVEELLALNEPEVLQKRHEYFKKQIFKQA